MSDSTIEIAMHRIKGATAESPIAVFRSSAPGMVNAVFAGTVATQRMIANGDPRLIGVYDQSMSPAVIRGRLERVIGKQKTQ
jgi:hypothetical protein